MTRFIGLATSSYISGGLHIKVKVTINITAALARRLRVSGSSVATSSKADAGSGSDCCRSAELLSVASQRPGVVAGVAL